MNNDIDSIARAFGVPLKIKRHGEQCTLVKLTLDGDGISANYLMPGEIKSINVTGFINLAKTMVFKNDKERIKRAVMEEAQNFCDMIDCVDEPPCLDYQVNKYGIEVIIKAEIKD